MSVHLPRPTELLRRPTVLGATVGCTGLCVVAVIAGYFLLFGKVIAEVPMARLGETFDRAIALPGGTRLQLTVHATRWSQEDCERMPIHVELLRSGERLIDVQGDGFDFSDATGAWGSVADVATVDLPAGGLDEIRVVAGIEPSSCKMEFEGLVLQLRKPRF